MTKSTFLVLLALLSIAVSLITDLAVTGYDSWHKVKECENSLPRTQTCRIIAVPINEGESK